jgi:AcrR family transcriptional regulator
MPRIDALRNREALVRAARTVFGRDGLDAKLEVVAREAGVGPATLYRHFASKPDLLQAIFEQRFEEELEPALAAAAADADPWRGFVMALHAALEQWAGDPVLTAIALEPGRGPMAPAVRRRLFGPLEDLAARAQAAGRLRGDLAALDLPVLTRMLLVAAGAGGSDGVALADPRRWERYLALMLDALRAERAHQLPARAT